MILLTIYGLFTMKVNDVDGRKKPENEKGEMKEKFPVWLPSPPFIELEADCFPGQKQPKTSRTYPRWDNHSATSIKYIPSQYISLLYHPKPPCAWNFTIKIVMQSLKSLSNLDVCKFLDKILLWFPEILFFL